MGQCGRYLERYRLEISRKVSAQLPTGATSNIKRAPVRDAVDQYQKTATLQRPRQDLLLDWALAYDCAGNTQEAVAKLQQAAAQRPSAHVYSQIGMEFGKMGKYPEAMAALEKAQELNPDFAMTYFYLGNIHSIQGNPAQAIADYQHVLALDPDNQPAREALARMGR